MLKVSAAEFQRNIGKYQDMALREPIAVTRNGREGTILISADDYRDLLQNYRKVMRLEDFTEKDIRAIENARPSEEAKAFDHEVEN
jgi:prevent-host-death family protein